MSLTLGCHTAKLPIVQGGMGIGISLSRLAGAVAKCGGVGTISGVQLGYRDPEFTKDPLHANLQAIGRELSHARQIAPEGVIGFNFMSVMNHYDTYVREAIAQGADFIVSGAGLPTGLAKLAQGTKTAILPIVSSARALRLIVKSWLRADKLPDAVVVEGPLAGGHLGFKYDDMVSGNFPSLDTCLTEVLDYVHTLEETYHTKIPVIAGGGVQTQADVAHLMQLGASGVQVGTRFVVTEECDAGQDFKNAYLRAKPEDIQIIKSPVGLAARALNGNLLRMAQAQGRIPVTHCHQCMPQCKQNEIKYCISQALLDAVQGPNGLVFCGAGVSSLTQMTTVPEVIRDLLGA
ncbi:MAG: nitronate monooxygenase [Butyricicoccus pullicaecorum]|nr:nitronate monooxygenase [Butyricicoccus pullicaecorum]